MNEEPKESEKTDSVGEAMEELARVVARLRAPDGCPWDREQDHDSLRYYAVEEVYELLEAIEENDDTGMEEELGDLLLQVALHCHRMCSGIGPSRVRRAFWPSGIALSKRKKPVRAAAANRFSTGFLARCPPCCGLRKCGKGRAAPDCSRIRSRRPPRRGAGGSKGSRGRSRWPNGSLRLRPGAEAAAFARRIFSDGAFRNWKSNGAASKRRERKTARLPPIRRRSRRRSALRPVVLLFRRLVSSRVPRGINLRRNLASSD